MEFEEIVFDTVRLFENSEHKVMSQKTRERTNVTYIVIKPATITVLVFGPSHTLNTMYVRNTRYSRECFYENKLVPEMLL